MKNSTLILLFFILSFKAVNSQENIYDTLPHGYYDFSKIKTDTINVDLLYKKLEYISFINDSFNLAFKTDSLYQLYNYLSIDSSKDYTSFCLASGTTYADIEDLNNGLKSNNLPTLNSMDINFSFLSCSWKRKRFVHDIDIIEINIGQSADQNQIRIRYSFLNLLNYRFGYSIINANRFDLFPYLGLELQNSNLSFENSFKNDPNTNIFSYDTLVKFVTDYNEGSSIYFSKWDLAINYGFEADFHISN